MMKDTTKTGKNNCKMKKNRFVGLKKRKNGIIFYIRVSPFSIK